MNTTLYETAVWLGWGVGIISGWMLRGIWDNRDRNKVVEENMKDIGNCADAVDDLSLGSVSCCESSHTDADNFVYELIEEEIDGKKYYVCCSVWNVIYEVHRGHRL